MTPPRRPARRGINGTPLPHRPDNPEPPTIEVAELVDLRHLPDGGRIGQIAHITNDQRWVVCVGPYSWQTIDTGKHD